jgi:hypothetical protein
LGYELEMYFVRGSPRTNWFGANPLPKIQTRSRRELKTELHMASAWDQFSELEIVPHTASPPPGPHVNRGHE